MATTVTLRRGFLVREGSARLTGYEDEGSERRSLGSMAVGPEARWAATLTVPVHNADVVFVQIERFGPLPVDYRGSEETANFSMPIGEVDALIALLIGVIAQARGDGVLPTVTP